MDLEGISVNEINKEKEKKKKKNTIWFHLHGISKKQKKQNKRKTDP